VAENSEELGLVADASRHTAATAIDLEQDFATDDEGDFSRRCLQRTVSPLVDYLQSYRAAELIICLTFFLVTNTFPSWYHLTPYQRPIPAQYLEGSGEYVKNLTHDEVFDTETVPYFWLIALSGFAPLVLQVLLSVGRSWGRIAEVHQTLCVYFCAWSLNMIAVEFVKNYVGYLRPNDDFSECMGGEDAANHIRKSFPSGHSATAFCGLTLLALYIHTRLGAVTRRSYQMVTVRKGMPPSYQLVYDNSDGKLPLCRLVSVLALAPLMVALWIAASRVRDNKHFPADVLGGAMLGATVASYSHGLWFL
jgi:membrane-associated phospholipid phosphatase